MAQTGGVITEGSQCLTCSICHDFDEDSNPERTGSTIILTCGCCFHRECIINYIKFKLNDDAFTMKDIGGLSCPNVSARTCKNPELIINSTDVIDYFRGDHGIDVNKFIRFSDKNFESSGSDQLGEEKMGETLNAIELSQAYIDVTSKPCPNCNTRGTHYHGHSCHHISPNTNGCPNCKTHYCYRCLATGTENERVRGNRATCLCGFWSSYCKTITDITQINLSPVPHDNRC